MKEKTSEEIVLEIMTVGPFPAIPQIQLIAGIRVEFPGQFSQSRICIYASIGYCQSQEFLRPIVDFRSGRIEIVVVHIGVEFNDIEARVIRHLFAGPLDAQGRHQLIGKQRQRSAQTRENPVLVK